MLSQFCIRRPIFATVLSIIIVLAGLIALRVLPLSQYPDISPPTVRISTTYDGADAQTLARTVAAPIEDQLSGITGLLYYTTNIRSNGDMSISCVFDVGTDANDAMLEINNRVRTAERRLPDVVRNQGVSVRKRSEENLLMVALFSPDGSMAATDLADYANLNIVDELKRLPGIGDVSVFGNAQSAMRIWLDPSKMVKYKLNPSEVKAAISAQNAQVSAGGIAQQPTDGKQEEADRKMLDKIRQDVITILMPRVIAEIHDPAILRLFDEHITYHVNPTGKFVIGGPHGDTGLTGRKIIVDTYGGKGAHGGGAFSGKDPSKVDRSAAYAARHIAKNMVAAGVADEMLVQISYAIGVARPVNIYVNTYGRSHVSLSDGEIAQKIDALFDLRPKAIEDRLKLRNPIYEETAAYGHMGRQPQTVTKEFHSRYMPTKTLEVELFTWEKLDYVAQIKEAFGL